MAMSEIMIPIGANLDPFEAALKQANNMANAYATKIQSQLSNVKMSFGGMGGAGSYGGMNQTAKAMTQLNNTSNQFLKTMTKVSSTLAGGFNVGAAIGSLYALERVFGSAIAKAREYQTAKIAISAQLASAGSYQDKNGNQLPALQQQQMFRAQGTYFQKEIMKRQARNVLTYEEQLQSFQTGIAPGSRKGLKPNQILDITEKIAVVAKTLGLRGEQISNSTRMLLGGGVNVGRSTIGRTLGISNADIAGRQGKDLEKFLKSRMAGFYEFEQDFAKSWEGMLSTLEAKLSVQLAKLGDKILTPLAPMLEKYGMMAKPEQAPGESKKSYAARLKEYEEGTAQMDKLTESMATGFVKLVKTVEQFANSTAFKNIMFIFEKLANLAGVIANIAIFSKMLQGAQSLGTMLKSMIPSLEKVSYLSGINATRGTGAMSGIAPRGPLAGAGGQLNLFGGGGAGPASISDPNNYLMTQGKRRNAKGQFIPRNYRARRAEDAMLSEAIASAIAQHGAQGTIDQAAPGLRREVAEQVEEASKQRAKQITTEVKKQTRIANALDKAIQTGRIPESAMVRALEKRDAALSAKQTAMAGYASPEILSKHQPFMWRQQQGLAKLAPLLQTAVANVPMQAITGMITADLIRQFTPASEGAANTIGAGVFGTMAGMDMAAGLPQGLTIRGKQIMKPMSRGKGALIGGLTAAGVASYDPLQQYSKEHGGGEWGAIGAGFGSGALAGGAAGSMFGPVGTAIGTGVGGIAAAYKAGVDYNKNLEKAPLEGLAQQQGDIEAKGLLYQRGIDTALKANQARRDLKRTKETQKSRQEEINDLTWNPDAVKKIGGMAAAEKRLKYLESHTDEEIEKENKKILQAKKDKVAAAVKDARTARDAASREVIFVANSEAYNTKLEVKQKEAAVLDKAPGLSNAAQQVKAKRDYQLALAELNSPENLKALEAAQEQPMRDKNKLPKDFVKDMFMKNVFNNKELFNKLAKEQNVTTNARGKMTWKDRNEDGAIGAMTEAYLLSIAGKKAKQIQEVLAKELGNALEAQLFHIKLKKPQVIIDALEAQLNLTRFHEDLPIQRQKLALQGNQLEVGRLNLARQAMSNKQADISATRQVQDLAQQVQDVERQKTRAIEDHPLDVVQTWQNNRVAQANVQRQGEGGRTFAAGLAPFQGVAGAIQKQVQYEKAAEVGFDPSEYKKDYRRKLDAEQASAEAEEKLSAITAKRASLALDRIEEDYASNMDKLNQQIQRSQEDLAMAAEAKGMDKTIRDKDLAIAQKNQALAEQEYALATQRFSVDTKLTEIKLQMAAISAQANLEIENLGKVLPATQEALSKLTQSASNLSSNIDSNGAALGNVAGDGKGKGAEKVVNNNVDVKMDVKINEKIDPTALKTAVYKFIAEWCRENARTK